MMPMLPPALFDVPRLAVTVIQAVGSSVRVRVRVRVRVSVTIR